MYHPSGRDIHTRLLSLQRTVHRLNGAPLPTRQLPSALPSELDFAVVCHGRNKEDGSFDWLYSCFPNANANDEVLSPNVRDFLKSQDENAVILAGLCGSDPFHHHDVLLDCVMEAGFHGIHNFPGTSMLDGSFRSTMDQNHLGFQQEVRLMEHAVKRDIFTFAMVFRSADALLMRDVGVHALALAPSPATLHQQHDGLAIYTEECRKVLSMLQGDTLFFCCWPDRSAHAELAYFLHDISGFYSSLVPLPEEAEEPG